MKASVAAFEPRLAFSSAVKIKSIGYFQYTFGSDKRRVLVLGTTDGELKLVLLPSEYVEGVVVETYNEGFGGKQVLQIEVVPELSQLAVLVKGEVKIFKILQEDKPKLQPITAVHFLSENPPDIVHFSFFSAFVVNQADKTGNTSVAKAVLVAVCSKQYIYCVWDAKAGNYRVQYETQFPEGLKPVAVQVYKGFMVYSTKKGYFLQTQKGYFPIPVKGDLSQKFLPTCNITGSTSAGQIDVVYVVGNQLNYAKVSEPPAAAVKAASEPFGAQATQNILINAVVTPINTLTVGAMTKDVKTHLPFVEATGHSGSFLLYFGNTIVTTFGFFDGLFNCSFVANYMNHLTTYPSASSNEVPTVNTVPKTLNDKGGLNVLMGISDLSASTATKFTPGQGKSFQGSRAVSDIFILRPVPVEEITTGLAEPVPQDRDKVKFSLALDIASYADDSFKLQSHINALYGYYLFSQGVKEVNNAMAKFLESKCDPRCILRLVKGLIRDNIGMQIAMRENHPKTDELEVFDPQSKTSMKNQYLSAMISYIMKWRNLHLEDTNSALRNIADIESQNEFDMVLMKTVDTALLKCFIMQDTGADALVSFLSLPNNCDLKECESLLDNEKFYNALVILYKSNGMHDEALDKLCKRNKWFDAITYLVDMGGGPSHREELMKDPHTSKALHPESYYVDIHRKYTKLIFKTLIETNENECLTIYFAPVPEDAIPIDRRNGLEILQSVGAKDTAIMHFLDHVLLGENEGSADKELHNAMVRCSVSMLNEMCKRNGMEGRLGGANKVNQTSGIYPTNSAPRAGTEGDEILGEVRKKLVQFLYRSSKYDLKDALNCVRKFFPKGLLEEKAMIYVKMKDYETALRILAIKLSNAPLAERVCADIFTSATEPSGYGRGDRTDLGFTRTNTSMYANSNNDNGHIYNILMNVYLKPFPNNPEAVPYSAKIIQLLSTHWQKMSPSIVITSLSKSDIKISEIEEFLKNHYLSLNGNYRMTLLRKYALQARLTNLKEHKNALLNHSVMIDKDSVCPVCKDFIYSSAIVVYPNGRFVHRMCASNEKARAVVQEEKERGWKDMTAEPYFN